MQALIVVFAFCLLVATTNAKIWTKCELARELYNKHGFQKENLPDWMCLVQSESNFNQLAVGGPNSNGTFDWGLFQINDQYWCVAGGPPGLDCNMDCNKLLDTDLTDDVACVRKIFARHSWTAWNGWKAKCQGVLPSVDECF